MADTYIAGAVIRVSASFKTDGAPVDPTTVSAVVKTPDGTSTTYNYPATVAKDDVGIYHLDIATSATSVGQHIVRFSSTGLGQAADEATFNTKTRL